MKASLLIQATIGCLYLVFAISANAQLNLIPDPSFEQTTTTINGIGQESLLKWKSLDSTKSIALRFVYFSSNSQNMAYKLPDNQWCYQEARSGEGVTVLDSWWFASSWFKRSYARTKLKSALISGKTYCAKMYVNTADKYYGYFTDAIQMYFDNGKLDTIVAIDSVGPYTFVNPQVSNPTGNILNDTLNWVAVMGTFIANGTETFLTIGNFKSDNNCTKIFNPVTYVPPDTIFSSEMLIDDVSLIPMDASNWLHDVSCILGDSVYVGLPEYEMPDGMWYDINMNFIKKGSGFKVKPTQWATKYIMQIDLCGTIRSDTLTVWTAPDGITEYYKTAFSLFPNPATNEITIRYYGNVNPNTEVVLYNTIGQSIIEIPLPNSGQINISVLGLTNGIYFVKCGNKVTKFLKE